MQRSEHTVRDTQIQINIEIYIDKSYRYKNRLGVGQEAASIHKGLYSDVCACVQQV